MNEAFHQFVQLILQGITWIFRTLEALWVWSWAQIASLANISWGDLPGWKLAIGLMAVAVLAVVLVGMFLRGWEALARIAAAFWTMAVTAFALVTFVVMAGLFSRGFQWVVANVPDKFWETSG
jgi:hypothetical protein